MSESASQSQGVYECPIAKDPRFKAAKTLIDEAQYEEGLEILTTLLELA